MRLFGGKMGKYFWPLLFPLSFLLGTVSNATSPNELRHILYQGHEAYEKGQYTQALTHYLRPIKEGIVSGELYFNLGNTYYRLGKLGEAIFYFRLSKQLLPRNADVDYNLQFARRKVRDQIRPADGPWLTFLHQPPLNRKERLIFLALVSLIFWSLQIVLLFRERPAVKWARNISAIPFVLAWILAIWEWPLLGKTQFGVVTDPQIKVYSATGKDNVVLFHIHKGTEFSVLERGEDPWIKIELADGKKGWVPRTGAIVQ